MDKDLIDTFLRDPNWKRMESFIVAHFANSMDISDIDSSLDSSVVHAEVIARQRIAKDVNGLLKIFENARTGKTSSKVSYE